MPLRQNGDILTPYAVGQLILGGLSCLLLVAMLTFQTRLASGVTAPLATKTVFALVLAALLIGLGYV